MKTIGIMGGITWHSSLEYYRVLNEIVHKRLGGVHSAKIVMDSLDFGEIKPLTENEYWDKIEVIAFESARSIEAAGADCLLLAANTMHTIAEQIQASINIPIIHIAEAVTTQVNKQGIKTTALLGTKYTMKKDFYKNKLAALDISSIIPNDEDIEYINNTIFNEFSKGVFFPEAKQKYLQIIDELSNKGAEGVIFGCTEIPILLKQKDCNIPVFDSGLIHCIAAIDFALA